jgi:hypothetical protein
MEMEQYSFIAKIFILERPVQPVPESSVPGFTGCSGTLHFGLATTRLVSWLKKRRWLVVRRPTVETNWRGGVSGGGGGLRQWRW